MRKLIYTNKAQHSQCDHSAFVCSIRYATSSLQLCHVQVGFLGFSLTVRKTTHNTKLVTSIMRALISLLTSPHLPLHPNPISLTMPQSHWYFGKWRLIVPVWLQSVIKSVHHIIVVRTNCICFKTVLSSRFEVNELGYFYELCKFLFFIS